MRQSAPPLTYVKPLPHHSTAVLGTRCGAVLVTDYLFDPKLNLCTVVTRSLRYGAYGPS